MGRRSAPHDWGRVAADLDLCSIGLVWGYVYGLWWSRLHFYKGVHQGSGSDRAAKASGCIEGSKRIFLHAYVLFAHCIPSEYVLPQGETVQHCKECYRKLVERKIQDKLIIYDVLYLFASSCGATGTIIKKPAVLQKDTRKDMLSEHPRGQKRW